MKKRMLSLLLAAVLLCALLPTGSVQAAAKIAAFNDVDSGAWYAPYVYALVQKGIINGTTPKTFAPESRLTRSQLMKMIACFAADDKTLQSYAGANTFPDVKAGAWYETHVNWAADHQITSGYEDGTFKPEKNVSRAEAATLAARFAQQSELVELKPVKDKTAFKDDAKLPDWAKEHVYLCQQAGVINGYPDGTFRGDNTMTRAEAAKVLCLLFGIAPMAKEDLPVNVAAGVKTISGTYAGYSVTGVQFDPRAYQASVVLAKNRFYATESAASMVSRSGAVVACNGAFFNNKSDLTTWSAFVRNGEVLRIDNARAGSKCYFVVDKSGRASMQFLTILQTTVLVRDGEEIDKLENVGCNFALGEGDNARMVFTKTFGRDTVPVKMKCAVWCDENGVVTKTMDASTAQTITIPEKGFVVCSAHRQDDNYSYKWDKFFENARVGDVIRRDVRYDNSSVQDIQMAFSCGPTVVKNGKVYGSSETYAAEGYGSDVTSGSAKRMCIGVKADGTVVMASATCDLKGLGKVMQALGCQTAMNLDGGSSCALYVNGSARIAPGRELTHMIVFTAK